MKVFRFILFYFLLLSNTVKAQGNFVLQEKSSDRINFELINNLIIFPVEVNGVELSFLLDTGVSKPIIFNFLNINEALKIHQAEQIYIRGLGEGEAIEAIKSKGNVFKIGEALNINQDLYAVFDPSFNFAPRLGVPIHGIIGYDFIKDFVVEINYAAKYFKLHKPKNYKPKKCKNCETLNVQFLNNKPYIEGKANIDGQKVPVLLLVDTGGSDALWLFEDEKKGLTIPDKYFEDFLGRGLSGRVFGKRTRIESFSLKSFDLDEVNVAFPDSSSTAFARIFKDRSGSVSGDILKRFNIVLNYSKSEMTFKRNKYFAEPFSYNKSGIELEHDGVRVVKEINRENTTISFNSSNTSVATQEVAASGSYKYALAPSFRIVELRNDSPAQKAGLKLGDVILSINGRSVHTLSMQELIQHFYSNSGKKIKLLVDRQGTQMKFEFRLESLF